MAHKSSTRILVAEDDRMFQKVVLTMLEVGGWTDVMAVEDGEAALSALQDRRYDLVISDLHMNPVDGMSLLHAIRAEPLFQGIPFILMTAEIAPRLRGEALGAGAQVFLNKPFSRHDLTGAVAEQLALRKPPAEIVSLAEARLRRGDWPVVIPAR